MTDFNPNENKNETDINGNVQQPTGQEGIAQQAAQETTQSTAVPPVEPVAPTPSAEPPHAPVPEPPEMPMPQQPKVPQQESYPYVSPEIQGVNLTLETDPPEPQYYHPPEAEPAPNPPPPPPYYGTQQNAHPPRYQPPQYRQNTYQQQAPSYYQPVYYPPQGYQQKSRLAAAILALTLGSLGIHNFYLGFKNRGVIQILLCTFGSMFFGLGFFAAIIWGFIEGILLLIGNENRRFDGNGVILKE